MNEERLFCENEYDLLTNLDTQNYLLFVREIINHSELTNHKELEPFRDNIYKLFSLCGFSKLSFINWGDLYYWYPFIDKVVYLARSLKDIQINFKLFRLVKMFPFSSIELLATLYVPSIVTNHDVYLESCYSLMHLFFTEDIYNSTKKYNTGDRELNCYYTYFRSLIKRGMKYEDLRNELGMMGLIYAYLHKKNVIDIELFARYFSDKDLYKERVMMNCPMIFNKNGRYDYKNTKLFLDNFDLIFNNSNKELIKN